MYHLELLQQIIPLLPLPFVLGISAGGGTSNTDTRFERSGTSNSTQQHVVPPGLASLLASLGSASVIPASTTTNEIAALNGVMTQPETVPSRGSIDAVTGQTPEGYRGFEALNTMSGIDPYSAQYETDTTDAYKRRAGETFAQMESGPAAVRGATERVPLAQGQMATSLAEGRGEEVRKATTNQAGITSHASQLMSMLDQARKAASMAAQSQLFQQLYGIRGQKLAGASGVDSARSSSSNALDRSASWLSGGTSQTVDDLKGKGNQGSSHFGGEVGTNCCFIFLQAFNGILPWYIDLARRDYYTPKRRAGYKWVSSWLVPRMARSRSWSLLVNFAIIRPFLAYGSWLYGAGSKSGWVMAPYCKGWLALWNVIGGFVR